MRIKNVFMKNFKQFIPVLVFIPIMLLLVVASCDKNFDDPTNPATEDPTENNMESLKISSDFDWRTSDNITFNVSSATSDMIKITSEDGSIMYYKGSHPGNNEVEVVYISVPRSVNGLAINGHSMIISGEEVDIDLSSYKTASLVNQSIYFDGVDDYGLETDNANTYLDGVSAFTIEGWLKPTTINQTAVVFQKQQGDFADVSVNFSAGDFNFEVGDGTDAVDGSWTISGLSDDEWFHFAVVFDGGNGLLLYINGSIESFVETIALGSFPNSTFASLGAQNGFIGGTSSSLYFKGNMDELRFWDDIRSSVEIGDNMNIELVGDEANLVSYYKFDEFLSTTPDLIEDLDDTNDFPITLDGGCSLEFDLPTAFDTDGDGATDVNDDYPDDDERAYDNYFPAAGFGSLGFEDLWPGKGDYDFNDVVVDYQFKTVTDFSGDVVEIIGTFPVKASGAVLHNGFGFNLPTSTNTFTSNTARFVVTGSDIQESYITLNAHGHEDAQAKATVIVFDDIFNLLGEPGAGIGVNTEEWVPSVAFDTVTITITSGTTNKFVPAHYNLIDWNPFIIVGQDRGHEVHLAGFQPTSLMDLNMLGTGEDNSVLNGSVWDSTFATEANLPWAIDIPITFEWPREKIEIVWAYLKFREWAESSGTLSSDWYEDNWGYREDDNIYDYVAPTP